MRKIMVFLLVVGIVLGMTPAFIGLSEHCSVSDSMNSLYDVTEADGNNPAPCGGGMGSGGGGGLPG